MLVYLDPQSGRCLPDCVYSRKTHRIMNTCSVLNIHHASIQSLKILITEFYITIKLKSV